jgi:hypothetical protein
MKKFTFLATICLIGMNFIFSGCKKDDEDARNQYVGTYKETAIGSLEVITPNGTGTVSADFSGTYQISKGSSPNTLIKLESGKSTNGVFSNPSVTFENEIQTADLGNGQSLQLTISMTGTFSTNIFVTTRTITGTFYTQGASFPVSGIVTGNATKL